MIYHFPLVLCLQAVENRERLAEQAGIGIAVINPAPQLHSLDDRMSQSQAVAAERPVSRSVVPQGVLPSWKVLLLVVLTAGVYYDVLWRLIHQWSIDPNFSHGFVVPLFVGFVVWTKRQQLSAIPARPSGWGLPIVVGSLLLTIVGSLGAELFVARVSLLSLLAGMIIYFLGWKHFQALLFPWFCLFLMIPIPAIIFAQLTLPLQFLAAKLAAGALQMVGIPVFREGNVIALPAMPLEVAEACSGIRSLLSLGTLAIIYGFFLEERTVPRALIALTSIPIAVIANGFRIFGTGVLVQYWGPERALGFFHEFSGWLVFVVSMFLLFITHKIFSKISKLTARKGAE
jgi:exosortase